jgi:hypothetical protein
MTDQVGIIREGRLVDLWQVSVLKSHALRRFELDFARPVPAAVFERLSGVADEGAVLALPSPLTVSRSEGSAGSPQGSAMPREARKPATPSSRDRPSTLRR